MELATTINHETDIAPATIHGRELAEFYALTHKNQQRIRDLLAAFAIIEAAPAKMEGYTLAAQGRRGLTHGSLRRLYREYCNGGRNWRVLIDGAVEYKPTDCGLPSAFVEEVQRRCDAQSRSVAMAFKLLRTDWFKGVSIPGYGTWREWWTRTKPFLPVPPSCPCMPPGWSETNLRSYLDASAFRRKAQTIGLQSAHKHNGNQVYTTRAKLYVGSHYQFDDLWHDFFVASLREKKVGRVLELFAHDLFSARKFRFGYRVRTEGDNGKANGLTMRMQRMLLADVFLNVGYSPRGTVGVFEHGTAACPEDIEKALYDGSGGLVTVHRSGMQGAAAHAGHYPGLVRGNPRHKASLESSNNAIHNLTSHLPGQTGPDRQRRPEQLAGMLEYSAEVLAAMPHLSASAAEALKLPLLTEIQAGQVLRELYAAFDEMPHNLEGWRDAGNVIAELCFAGQWLAAENMLALPPAEREAVALAMNSGSLQARERRLTRGEVWRRGEGELVKVSPAVACAILGPEFAKEQRVKSHIFNFRDVEIEPGIDLKFESLVHGPETSVYLKEGEPYRITVNPQDPRTAFVCDMAGRFLGVCQRITAVDRADCDAVTAQIARIAKSNAEVLAPLKKRQLHEAKRRRDLHKHNVEVIKRDTRGGDKNRARALDILAAHFSE